MATTSHTYTVQGTRRVKREGLLAYEAVPVEIHIDFTRIARQLADRAANAKTGRAVGMSGAVTAKAPRPKRS